METIEERYDSCIAAMADAIDREDIDAMQSINKDMPSIYVQWCKEAPVATLDIRISNKEFEKSLKKCKPIIKSLPDGKLFVCLHGTNDGELVVSPTLIVRYDDNRFTDLFPEGAHVEVLACYPGSRPNRWDHNGRHFHNVGDCAVSEQLTMGYDFWTDKVYVRPVSEAHSKFTREYLENPSPFMLRIMRGDVF